LFVSDKRHAATLARAYELAFVQSVHHSGLDHASIADLRCTFIMDRFSIYVKKGLSQEEAFNRTVIDFGYPKARTEKTLLAGIKTNIISESQFRDHDL
jgi:hypothetical protein